MQTTEYRIPLDHPAGHSLFACEIKIATTTTSASTDEPEVPVQSEQPHQTKFVVLVVHGGPGLNSHEESLEGLKPLLLPRQTRTACDDANVCKHPSSAASALLASCCCPWIHALVFYDQLGCGQQQQQQRQQQGEASEHERQSFGPVVSNNYGVNNSAPEHHYLYSLNYYVDELQQVLRATRQRFPEPDIRICVLGHSWGGQIVLEYLLQRQQQQQDTTTNTDTDRSATCIPETMLWCDAAIISNAPLKESTYEQRQQVIRQALPDDVRAFLEAEEHALHKDTGTNRSIGAAIYRKLIGLSDTHITGELKDWNALKRLHHSSSHLPCPALFLAGTNDTVPHEEYQSIAENYSSSNNNNLGGIKAQVAILEGGDHAPFYGDTAPEYISRIQAFLKGLL